MPETLQLSQPTQEHDSSMDQSMTAPLQRTTRMSSAMPPNQSRNLQSIANNSHHVSQLRALKPGGAPSGRPVQRVLKGESKVSNGTNIDPAYDRYMDRKKRTQRMINQVPGNEDANRVRMMVFSGTFGQD